MQSRKELLTSEVAEAMCQVTQSEVLLYLNYNQILQLKAILHHIAEFRLDQPTKGQE